MRTANAFQFATVTCLVALLLAPPAGADPNSTYTISGIVRLVDTSPLEAFDRQQFIDDQFTTVAPVAAVDFDGKGSKEFVGFSKSHEKWGFLFGVNPGGLGFNLNDIGQLASSMRLSVGHFFDPDQEQLLYDLPDPQRLYLSWATEKDGIAYRSLALQCPSYSSLLVVDVDGDTVDELLLLGTKQCPTRLLRFSPNAEFQEKVIENADFATAHSLLRAADFDGDSCEDVFAVTKADNAKMLYWSDCKGGFSKDSLDIAFNVQAWDLLIPWRHGPTEPFVLLAVAGAEGRIARIEFSREMRKAKIKTETVHSTEAFDQGLVLNLIPDVLSKFVLKGSETSKIYLLNFEPSPSLSLLSDWFAGEKGIELHEFQEENSWPSLGVWEPSSRTVYSLQILRPLRKVRVSAGFGKTVFTDDHGVFSLTGLSPGKYVLDASRMGYRFEPSRLEVEVVDKDIDSLHFEYRYRRPQETGPRLCIGYNPTEHGWGHRFKDCPAGYAVYSIIESKPINTEFHGLECCPLPDSDVLSDVVEFHENTCPKNFVVTGRDLDTPCEDCVAIFRCTKINTDRYKLSKDGPAYYWGNGFSQSTNASLIRRSDFPLGMRHGVGRTFHRDWGVDGCIGKPFGSLFSGKAGDGCRDIVFRTLLYAGKQGDPPEGSEVKMFPDCKKIDNIYSPLAKCVP